MQNNIKQVADVLIIGSGVAGAVCANALAAEGVKVCVLEAGPEIFRAETVQGFMKTPDQDFSAGFPNSAMAPRPNWQADADPFIVHTGTQHPTLEYLRVLGGTTWHWGATAIRMLPNDFHMKTLYGVGEDWPISYRDIEPYYLLAEQEMGVAGSDTFDEEPPRSGPFPLPPVSVTYAEKVLSEKLLGEGVKFGPRPSARNSLPYDGRPQCQGYSFCSPICPVGAQYSAMVHVEKARNLGVHFDVNTRADRLYVKSDGLIDYVQVMRKDGTQEKLSARIIILAANGIENARLLLMSDSESFPAGLANSSGVVGRYFMDHPGISCWMLLKQPVYAGRGPESTLISYSFRDGKERKQRAAWSLGIINRIRLHEITKELLDKNYFPPLLDETIQYRAAREIEIDLQFEQLADPDNRMSIDKKQYDSAGQPLVRLHYGYGSYEQAGFSAGKKLIDKFCRKLDVEHFSISSPGTRHHLMGTTRMGNDRRTSVVDANCQSHDHKNLYILGSSVFPCAGTANPTLTIAALSLRTARVIARQLKFPA